MAQPWAQKFYNSKQWITTRNAYYASVYGLCEECGAPGDEVHHKIYLTPGNINNPNITLNWGNLKLLCFDCHKATHSSDGVPQGMIFDREGNLMKR
ncbi:MAG: HNH endonuclease [Eubacteriales bacterium]